MTPAQLYNARQLWKELILTGEGQMLDWAAWTDAALLAIAFTPPEWLYEMALTDNFSALARIVEFDIHRDHLQFLAFALDDEALSFGLVYNRFKHCGYKEIWRQLGEVGNPDDFLHSGRWKHYQPNAYNDIEQLDTESLTHEIFSPPCEYALHAVERLLGPDSMSRIRQS